MAPTRGHKRKSDQITASAAGEVMWPEVANQKVATKAGDEAEQSPVKRQKVGLTLLRKQQLIDNLQREIAERARKLRADYNKHIRHLRFRIETRANRIPPALLKTKMGDLLAKRTAEEQQKAIAPLPSAARPPPVPPKDVIVGRPALQRTAQGSAHVVSPARMAKRTSDDMSGGDKENEMTHIENPKKKARTNPAGAATTRPPPNPCQVLSPTSSNSRVLPPRERAAAVPSPSRSFIARPVSPAKPVTSNSGMFSSMVEKARSTRAAATTRKTTTSSTASSTAGSTAAAATRARKGATAAAPPASRAGAATSRTTRRVSAISESSDGSTGTVVRKRTTTAAAAAAPAPAAKRTVMGTIRKGVTGAATKKAQAAKPAPPVASTGRVLRKRN